MTEDDGRVAALAVAFAKDRAQAFLSRLATPGGADAVRLAARLAAATRHERLRRVAAALAIDAGAARACSDDAAALERPRVARLLLTLGAGTAPADDCAPILVRLCRERLGR